MLKSGHLAPVKMPGGQVPVKMPGGQQVSEIVNEALHNDSGENCAHFVVLYHIGSDIWVYGGLVAETWHPWQPEDGHEMMKKNTTIIFDYLGASFMPLKNF